MLILTLIDSDTLLCTPRNEELSIDNILISSSSWSLLLVVVVVEHMATIDELEAGNIVPHWYWSNLVSNLFALPLNSILLKPSFNPQDIGNLVLSFSSHWESLDIFDKSQWIILPSLLPVNKSLLFHSILVVIL